MLVTRSRGSELYLNARCLLRAAIHGEFRKMPFFLHHIWSALVE